MSLETVTIVRIYPTAIWIEDDICGSRHVMLQHEGMHSFCYASFGYDYAYTDNAGTHAAAHALALQLGATEPIEHRMRSLPVPGEADPDVLREIIEYYGADAIRQALEVVAADPASSTPSEVIPEK